jgi:hypothetical protein
MAAITALVKDDVLARPPRPRCACRRRSRYDALLRLTTDHQAITAIEQLIRETRDRLNELDRADDRSGGADY